MACETQPDSVGSLVMPCAGGCGPAMGRVTYPVLAEQDVTNLGIGTTISMPPSDLQDQSNAGLKPHIASLTIRASLRFTAADGTSAAIPAYQIAGCLQQMVMKDCSGHTYFTGLDGRSLVDDRWMRDFRLGPEGIGNDGIAVDVGAGAHDLECTWTIQFASRRGGYKGMMPWKALADAGLNALQFQLAQPPGGTYTDIVLTGFTPSTRIQWEAEVVWIPRAQIPRAFQIDRYQLLQPTGRLWHADRAHAYVALRPWAEETNSISLAAIDGVTVQTGNDVVVKSLRAAQFLARDTRIVREDDFAILDGAADPQGLPVTLGTIAASKRLMLQRSRSFRTMPKGAVTYNFSASPGNAFFPFLHRTELCQSGDRAQQITRAIFAGCGDPSRITAVVVDDDGNQTTFDADPGATILVG